MSECKYCGIKHWTDGEADLCEERSEHQLAPQREIKERADKAEYRLELCEAQLGRANNVIDEEDAEIARLKGELDKETARLDWPRCDECNCELTDYGEGRGLECNLCHEKERADAAEAETKSVSATWEKHHDAEIARLKAELAQVRAEAAQYIKETDPILDKLDQRNDELDEAEGALKETRTTNHEAAAAIVDAYFAAKRKRTELTPTSAPSPTPAPTEFSRTYLTRDILERIKILEVENGILCAKVEQLEAEHVNADTMRLELADAQGKQAWAEQDAVDVAQGDLVNTNEHSNRHT